MIRDPWFYIKYLTLVLFWICFRGELMCTCLSTHSRMRGCAALGKQRRCSCSLLLSLGSFVRIDRTVMIKHIAAGYRFPSGSEVLRVWCRLNVLTSISQQVLQDLVPAVLQHVWHVLGNLFDHTGKPNNQAQEQWRSEDMHTQDTNMTVCVSKKGVVALLKDCEQTPYCS